jgi:death-on-curing protein
VTSPSITISSEEIIKVHDNVISDYGGQAGILDKGTLEYLQYEIHKKLMRSLKKDSISIHYLAAFLLHGIITKHPFQDGHKRTGFLIANSILDVFGYSNRASDKKRIEFLKQVAEYGISIEEVTDWLTDNYTLDHEPYSIVFDYDEKDYTQFTIKAKV